LLVLTLFGLFQVAILYGLTKWYCGPPGAFVPQSLVLLSLTVAGTAVGLFLSAVSSTEDMAVSLIPVAIIPQVILAGGVAPLSGVAHVLAKVGITTYWGKRALDGLLPSDTFDLARAGELAEPEVFWAAVAITLAHAIVFVTAAVVVMTLQGRAAARVMHRLRRAVRKDGI
jgi:hypothetical protein